MDLISFIHFSRWLDAKYPVWNRAQKAEALFLFSRQHMMEGSATPHFSANAFRNLLVEFRAEDDASSKVNTP